MTNTPRKGDPITYRGTVVGHVSGVDGNLCWYRKPDGAPDLFIWQYHGSRGGLNEMHHWPTKHAEVTPCQP